VAGIDGFGSPRLLLLTSSTNFVSDGCQNWAETSKLNTCVMNTDAATGRETGWMDNNEEREALKGYSSRRIIHQRTKGWVHEDKCGRVEEG
jgi:hypothetical protein